MDKNYIIFYSTPLHTILFYSNKTRITRTQPLPCGTDNAKVLTRPDRIPQLPIVGAIYIQTRQRKKLLG